MIDWRAEHKNFVLPLSRRQCLFLGTAYGRWSAAFGFYLGPKGRHLSPDNLISLGKFPVVQKIFFHSCVCWHVSNWSLLAKIFKLVTFYLQSITLAFHYVLIRDRFRLGIDSGVRLTFIFNYRPKAFRFWFTQLVARRWG